MGRCSKEIDWAVGQIFTALKKRKIDEPALVIWPSDNGAPRRSPQKGGNGPLGGWGYTTAENAYRTSSLAGFMPANSFSNELRSLMDSHPTLPNLPTRNCLPASVTDRHLALVEPALSKTPDDFFYYYRTH